MTTERLAELRREIDDRCSFTWVTVLALLNHIDELEKRINAMDAAKGKE